MNSPDSIEERVIHGIAAVPGIADGKAHVYVRERLPISERDDSHSGMEEELQKLENALSAVQTEFENIAVFAKSQTDDTTLSILGTQKAILADPELQNRFQDHIINDKFKADRAVYDAFDVYINAFASSGKNFLQLRLADLKDLRDRLIRHIQQTGVLADIPEKAIIVADDFSPTEVVLFSRRNVKALVVDHGGLNSHASIIAGALNIPMVVAARNATKSVESGDNVIVDGVEGKLIIIPGKKTKGIYKQKFDDLIRIEDEWQTIRELPAKTLCGKLIKLRANIEFEEELPNIEHYKTNGIGLLRTESFFLTGNQVAGNAHLQEVFYENAIKACNGETMTIRLFDVGGDKMMRSMEEDNPFLGWRGVRILLDRRELLRSQLRSICLIAGRYPGKVRILIPMVTSIVEVEVVRNELNDMISLLASEGHPVDKDMELGIMVEVPSTAILAENFARHVDFFSIGTNDLTQYTLAVDRGNVRVSDLYQQMHPAVWKLIRQTCEAAQKHGVEVTVCGELASYPFAALILISLGVCDLSMASTNLPAVKKAVISHDMEQAKAIAEKVFSAHSVEEVHKLQYEWKQKVQLKENAAK